MVACGNLDSGLAMRSDLPMSPIKTALLAGTITALIIFLVPLIWMELSPPSRGGGQPCVPIDGRALGIVMWLYFGAAFALAIGLAAGTVSYIIARLDFAPGLTIPLLCIGLVVGLFSQMKAPSADQRLEEEANRGQRVDDLIDDADLDGLIALADDTDYWRIIPSTLRGRAADPSSFSDEQLEMVIAFYRFYLERSLDPFTDRDIFWSVIRERQRRAGGITRVPGWSEFPAEVFDQFKNGRNQYPVEITDHEDLVALHRFALEHKDRQSARRVAVNTGVRISSDFTELIATVEELTIAHSDVGLAGLMLRSSTDDVLVAARPNGAAISDRELDALYSLARTMIAHRPERGFISGQNGSLTSFCRAYATRILDRHGIDAITKNLEWRSLRTLGSVEAIPALARLSMADRRLLLQRFEEHEATLPRWERGQTGFTAAMAVLTDTDPGCGVLERIPDYENSDLRRRWLAQALEVVIHPDVAECKGPTGRPTDAARTRIEAAASHLQAMRSRSELVDRVREWLARG